MNGKNKEVPLRAREENIKRLIETDGRYQEAYRMVRFYYEMNYKMGKSYHSRVFRAIYEGGMEKLQWKLANECNLSRTTLFDYRNEIVKCFEICLEEVKESSDEDGIKEIAVTETIREKSK